MCESRPVSNVTSAQLASGAPMALVMAMVFAPCDFANRNALTVSAELPEWEKATAQRRGAGARHDLLQVSVGIETACQSQVAELVNRSIAGVNEFSTPKISMNSDSASRATALR